MTAFISGGKHSSAKHTQCCVNIPAEDSLATGSPRGLPVCGPADNALGCLITITTASTLINARLLVSQLGADAAKPEHTLAPSGWPAAFLSDMSDRQPAA